ncbi:hypothetical protein [Lactobacillus apis]
MNSKKISIYRLSKLTGIPWSTIANYKKVLTCHLPMPAR